MLRDPARLEALLLDESRPVQLVVAGKSHPADDAGKALIQQIVRFADRPEVRHRIAFLPDYDMSMAQLLYWGCDVWLNNPLRPLEACGTSGMKSALNGGLNLSIRDGWWDEWFDGENGWAIPTADGVFDEQRRDDLEASALYDLVEQSVAPKFYDRDHSGVPVRWVEMVRHTLQSLGPKVLAVRMVRDYTEQYYAPAAASVRRVLEPIDGLPYGQARGTGRLPAAGTGSVVGDCHHRCRQRRAAGHPAARFGSDVDGEGPPGWSSTRGRHLQAVLGWVGPGDTLQNPRCYPMSYAGPGEHGTEIFTTTTPLSMSGSVGYTVRVLPHHPLLAGDAELGLCGWHEALSADPGVRASVTPWRGRAACDPDAWVAQWRRVDVRSRR